MVKEPGALTFPDRFETEFEASLTLRRPLDRNAVSWQKIIGTTSMDRTSSFFSLVRPVACQPGSICNPRNRTAMNHEACFRSAQLSLLLFLLPLLLLISSRDTGSTRRLTVSVRKIYDQVSNFVPFFLLFPLPILYILRSRFHSQSL